MMDSSTKFIKAEEVFSSANDLSILTDSRLDD